MRFNLDDIKADYDMRRIYPASAKRKDYDEYSLDVCLFHDDSKPSMLIGKDWFKCRAACPNGSGDVITWTMRVAGLSFVEACKQLEAGTAPLTMSNVRYEERPKTPPPIFKPDLPTDYVQGMMDQDYEDFQRYTGISRATAEAHEIGRFDYGIFTIPVRHPTTREVIDMKLYRPSAKKGEQLKTWHMEKGAPNALYGVPYINGDKYAVIVGGEKDTINGHEWHLPFVSDTAGEGSWDRAFNTFLQTRQKVFVFLDADDTGRAGMRRVRKKMERAIWCDWRHLWDANVKQGYDFSDFKAEGGTLEMFMEILKLAEDRIPNKPLKPRLRHPLVPPGSTPIPVPPKPKVVYSVLEGEL